MADQWEYEELIVETSALAATLNKWGAQGWELVNKGPVVRTAKREWFDSREEWVIVGYRESCTILLRRPRGHPGVPARFMR